MVPIDILAAVAEGTKGQQSQRQTNTARRCQGDAPRAPMSAPGVEPQPHHGKGGGFFTQKKGNGAAQPCYPPTLALYPLDRSQQRGHGKAFWMDVKKVQILKGRIHQIDQCQQGAPPAAS